MNILFFKKTLQIDRTGSDSIEILRIKYSELLNLLEFHTDPESFGVHFHKIIKIKSSGSGLRREDTFRIFREGNVSVYSLNDKVIVSWSVKLDVLYFLSMLIGIVFGFMFSLYTEVVLFYSVIAGMVGSLISIGIGILAIFFKIEEINRICLKKDMNSERA